LPHYVALLKSLTKYVERHNNESSSLEQYIILQNHANAKREREKGDTTSSSLYQELETHLLNSSHIVLTTLGSAGSRAVEAARKFEVIVIDEAAQSSEMNTLLALQLGSSHAILVGDPQQLPATIFSMSGRSNKYDRSLFQRLEQCKHPVVMLNIQYRMHPIISEFPRYIFYKGMLLDGSNTKSPSFGGELKDRITNQFPYFKPVTILDLNSKEEREGTGLSNMHEAQLALHLYISLDHQSDGSVSKNRVAVITPYAQQTQLLHRLFEDAFGTSYSNRVEIR
jgi:senataxin